MHWPPSTETRSFSATGMPEQRMQRVRGLAAAGPRVREPAVRVVRLCERSIRSIDSQACNP